MLKGTRKLTVKDLASLMLLSILVSWCKHNTAGPMLMFCPKIHLVKVTSG